MNLPDWRLPGLAGLRVEEWLGLAAALAVFLRIGLILYYRSESRPVWYKPVKYALALLALTFFVIGASIGWEAIFRRGSLGVGAFAGVLGLALIIWAALDARQITVKQSENGDGERAFRRAARRMTIGAVILTIALFTDLRTWVSEQLRSDMLENNYEFLLIFVGLASIVLIAWMAEGWARSAPSEADEDRFRRADRYALTLTAAIGVAVLVAIGSAAFSARLAQQQFEAKSVSLASVLDVAARVEQHRREADEARKEIAETFAAFTRWQELRAELPGFHARATSLTKKIAKGSEFVERPISSSLSFSEVALTIGDLQDAIDAGGAETAEDSVRSIYHRAKGEVSNWGALLERREELGRFRSYEATGFLNASVDAQMRLLEAEEGITKAVKGLGRALARGDGVSPTEDEGDAPSASTDVVAGSAATRSDSAGDNTESAPEEGGTSGALASLIVNTPSIGDTDVDAMARLLVDSALALRRSWMSSQLTERSTLMLSMELVIVMGALGALLRVTNDYLHQGALPAGRGNVLLQTGLEVVYGTAAALALFVLLNLSITATWVSDATRMQQAQDLNPFTMAGLGLVGGFGAKNVAGWLRREAERTDATLGGKSQTPPPQQATPPPPPPQPATGTTPAS